MTVSAARRAPYHVIGDVHGMADLAADALAHADDAGAHPVFLGDLVDKGPDSLGVLRLVSARLIAGTASMVRGNHDERLLTGLTSAKGRRTQVQALIDAAPDAAELRERFIAALSAAPYWISLPGYMLVHGAFHPEMLECVSGGAAAAVPKKLKAYALYGETDGTLNSEGFPIRTYRWIEQIPTGLTVLVGHDTRQMHEPLVVTNTAGGRAIFLDTGAAKGGKLSCWTIPLA